MLQLTMCPESLFWVLDDEQDAEFIFDALDAVAFKGRIHESDASVLSNVFSARFGAEKAERIMRAMILSN